MAKLVLHHAVPSRSSTVLWMLEEVGAPYELVLVDLKAERSAAHLALNPMGKVPVLQHGDAVLTETGAICTYLADAFPAAGLAPQIGDPLRAPYLRWMFFYGSCFEPALVDKALKRLDAPRQMMPYGDIDTTIDVAAKAVAAGPWFLGDRFTALDVYFGSGILWTTAFGILPDRPEFAGYIARLKARPALQRAKARDEALKGTAG